MTVDVVAACHRRPELPALLAALQSSGPGLRIVPDPSGMVVRLVDGADRPVLEVEAPLLVRTAGEVQRLLGTAAVTEPVWWVEAHAAHGWAGEGWAGDSWAGDGWAADARVGEDRVGYGPAHRFADVLAGAHDGVAAQPRVVPLSRWTAGRIAAAAAAAAAPVLAVTPAGSRITAPLETALRATGGRWVTRAPGGGWCDGLSGQRLVRSGSSFEPASDPEPERAVRGPQAARGSGAAPGAVADEPPRGAADPPADAGGTLRLRILALRPPDAELGGMVTDTYRLLTGAPPAGWGVAEPASEPWHEAELTDYCRHRAPGPSTLVVVGGRTGLPAVGTLTVSHQDAGVVEQLDLAAGSAAAPDAGQLARLGTLESPTVQIMLAAWVPGRADGTVEPYLPG